MRSWFIEKDIGDGPQSLEPERNLWAAVIAVAIEDLNGRGVLSAGDYGKMERFRAEQRRHALSWVLSSSIEVGSFRWACGQLEIDPGAAQQRILRADQQRTAGEKKPAAIAETAPAPPPTTTVHEIKPKVRKAMANNGNHNGHDDIETLKATAQRLGAELAAAELVVARLKPAVTYLNGAVAALEAKNPQTAETAWRSNCNSPRKALAPIPKKFPYLDVPLVQAIRTELGKSSEAVDHHQLIEAIFEIPDAKTFRRARSTLLSTMRHGDGRWMRLADGRYTLGAGEGIEPRSAAAR